MSLAQRDIEIGGETFVIGKLPTSDALRFGVILGRIFGSVIAGGLSKGIDPGMAPEEGAEEEEEFIDILEQMDIGKMVEGLMVHMDERKIPRLIQEMVEKSVHLPKYSEVWYETRFAGELGDLIELLTAIFEDNFGGAIETAKKKFPEFGRTISERFSDSSEGANGSSPNPEEESQPSFFDPSEENIAT